MSRFGRLLTAMVTPFDEHGDVDLEAAQKLARQQLEMLKAEVREDFQRSGLAHILAVSGSNVTRLIGFTVGSGPAISR